MPFVKKCLKNNRNCPCGGTVNSNVCSITRRLFAKKMLAMSCKFNNNGCQILHLERQPLLEHENICNFSLKNRTLKLIKSEPSLQHQCLTCFRIYSDVSKGCLHCERRQNDLMTGVVSLDGPTKLKLNVLYSSFL